MKVAMPFFMMAALILSACAATDGVVPQTAGACASDTSGQTAGMDWGKADIIDLKIENDQFSPLTINLNKGQAYVLRISNKEKVLRGFEARAFFTSIALAGITIGGKDYGMPCASGVNIVPQGTAELRFVALREGEYPFTNNSLLVMIPMSVGGAFGYITID